MKKNILVILVLLTLATYTSSCEKEAFDPEVKVWRYLKNKPPVAYAGPDQTIVLPVNGVTLNGVGTDIGGRVVSFEWSKIDGPGSGTIVDKDQPVTKVIALVEGQYTFEIKVVDNQGLSATDRVTITVHPEGGDPCAGCWDY